MPAALYMALVSSLLRAEASQGAPAEIVVRRVNTHLCDRDLDDMFVTLLYCDLNLHTRQLQVIRAGHERPLLWAGGHEVALDAGGRAVALGLVGDPPLDVQEMTLPPDATLLMYTDGVTDAVDENAYPFGRARLRESVANNLQLPTQALCDAIVGKVLAYHGLMPQFDDIAVMALRLAS
jgi:sigma-B regulation protein RsbU (phosphoserine phosphatase)